MNQHACRLIVKASTIVTLDPKDSLIADGFVAVDEGRIVGVGTSAELQDWKAEETVEGKGMVALPGLVNAHTHETLVRCYWDKFKGGSLLEDIMLAYYMELAVNEDHSYVAAKLNQLEMIKSGVTTFIDTWRHQHKAAEVLSKSGLRGILAPQIADRVSWPKIHCGRYWMESVEGNQNLLAEWHGKANGRIQVWFGPHAPYSCSEEVLLKCKDLALQHGVGVHIHLNEGLDEVRACVKDRGARPIEYLESINFFEPKVHAAHCVWLSSSEIKILRKHDVTISHQPRSNMKSAVGIADVVPLMKDGITVGLGTDSNMGPGNLDMFEEMRVALYLQRISKMNSRILNASDVLRMATLNGAKCLRMDHDIGSIEKGKKADLVLVDLKKPHIAPTQSKNLSNVVELLVHAACAKDVDTTIVDGRILMEHGKVITLDEEQILEESEEAAKDLMEKTIQIYSRERPSETFH